MKRFWEKVVKPKEISCWIWTGNRLKKGYGRIRMDRGMVLAHRLSYEWFYGPFNKNLCVLHTCDIPSCVNPKHLYTGTNDDNVRDKLLRGRSTKERSVNAGKANGRYIHGKYIGRNVRVK